MQARTMESAAAVGRRIGVHRNAVMRYVNRPGFPQPFVTPTGRKLFEVEKIERWMQESGAYQNDPITSVTVNGQEFVDTKRLYDALEVRQHGLKILISLGRVSPPLVINGIEYYNLAEIEELKLAHP